MNKIRLKNNHTSRLFFLFFFLVTMNFSVSAQKKNKNNEGNVMLGAHNANDNRLTRGFGGGNANTNDQLGTIVLYTHNDQGKTTFTVTNNETKQTWTGQDSVYLSDTTAKPDCSWGRVLKFFMPAGDYDVVTENDCGWGKNWNNPRHVNAGECKILNYSGCYHKPKPAESTTNTNASSSTNSTQNSNSNSSTYSARNSVQTNSSGLNTNTSNPGLAYTTPLYAYASCLLKKADATSRDDGRGNTLKMVANYKVTFTKCYTCNGTGQIDKVIVCPNCIDWSYEYRKKVPCNVCHDNREIKQGLRTCTLCNGTKKINDGDCKEPDNLAANICLNLNYDGHNDWYLPAINELESIAPKLTGDLFASSTENAEGKILVITEPQSGNQSQRFGSFIEAVLAYRWDEVHLVCVRKQ